MAHPHLRIVFIGLSITTSWGNRHASTYRSLTRALARRGHDVQFLERDVPSHAGNRDLPLLPWGRLMLYRDLTDLRRRFTAGVRDADLVVVGSGLHEGVAIGEWVTRTAKGMKAFYDLDMPATLAQLHAGDDAYLSRSLVPRYDLYLSTMGGPLLERLQTVFGAERVAPLYPSVDPEQAVPQAERPDVDLGHLASYAPDRQTSLELLLIEPARRWTCGRFAVAGAHYPESIAWPHNVQRPGHLPPPQHRAFYRSQRFTLSVTRSPMVEVGYSPSARLFEAAACGTPVISDWWPGIDEFFEPGREILVAGGPIDVLALVREMPEAQRMLVAKAARQRVLTQHTSDARALQLEEYLLEPATRLAAS